MSFLMLNFRTLKVFVPWFNVDRGESVTHFLFLHHFGEPHCRMISICRY